MTLNHKLFQQINNARFANVMNNTAIMNSFNCDNINIARIKMQHHQIMTIITNRNSKLKPMGENINKGKLYIVYCYYFYQHQFLHLKSILS